MNLPLVPPGRGIAGYLPSLTKLNSLICETMVDETLNHLPLIPHNLNRTGDASYADALCRIVAPFSISEKDLKRLRTYRRPDSC